MRKIFIMSLVLLCLLAGCSQSATWQTINAEQARQMMASEDYFLLDVRSEAEFHQAHIAGAVRISYSELAARAGELPSHSMVILVYCQTGRRSAIAAQVLAERGFARVYDFGGIAHWPFVVITGE